MNPKIKTRTSTHKLIAKKSPKTQILSYLIIVVS
jgi:hypothetical protein